MLTNDTDADGNGTINPATVTLVGPQANGTFMANADGTINFTPTTGFFGTASVNYTVKDEKAATSNQATLSITVAAPPTAVDDSYTGSYALGPTANINVLTNDVANSGTIDNTTISLGDPAGTPVAGTKTYTNANGVVFTVSGTGIITFTNTTAKFVGTTTVGYTVKNNVSTAVSNTGVLTLTLTNTAPVVVNVNGGTTPTTSALNNIAVLTNASDADGAATINKATVALVAGTQVGGGTFTVNTAAGANQGTINFTPTTGFFGPVSVNYTVSDELGATSSPATLNITVTAVADVATTAAPTAGGSVNAGAPLSFNVGFNNNGPNTADGFSRTLTLTAGLGAGNVTITGAGGLTGTYDSSTGAVTFNQIPTTLASGANLNVTVSIAAVPAALSSVVAATTITTSTGQGADNGANTASSTVTVVPVADVATTLTGPATITGNVTTGTFTVTFSDNGPSTAAGVTRIVTLPANATSITAPNGTVSAGTISYATFGTFTFTFVPANSGSSPVSTVSRITTTTSQNGATANDQATVPSTVKFTPVPNFVTAASIPSTNGLTAIASLTATDQDGAVQSFQILTVPPLSQGALYYNNGTTDVQITAAITLTPTQATTLKFAPTGAFAGNAIFTYAATDNEGNPSTTAKNGAGTIVQGAATYTIPVSNGGIIANNDSNVVPQNTPTPGNVLLNDLYPGTGLAVTTTGTATSGTTSTNFLNGVATLPSGAVVTIATTGGYTYTPPSATYIGPDKFAYQATAPGRTSVAALVTILVYDPGTACTSSTGPNQLVNPDFNAGNSGFSTYYTFITRPGAKVTAGPGGLYPEGTYAVDADANYYHGNFVGVGRAGTADKFLIVNGAPSIQRVYSQTVTVEKNRYYTFSAYLNNLIVPGKNLAVPEVGFVVNGESTSATRTITETPDRWVQVSDIWYSGSNTTAIFEIRNLSTDPNGNDFGIDDVYFGTCNLPPLAANDLTTTAPNTPITFIVSGSGTDSNGIPRSNDVDGDGFIDPTTVDLNPSLAGVQPNYTDASGNQFVLSTTGTGATATVSVVFTPANGFTGVASIPYVVKDNDGALSNPGTISVTVRPPATDLATTISASASTVDANSPETITVKSLNNGPATAQNVQQLLYLPAGLGTVTFTTTAGSGATLAAGAPVYDNTSGQVAFPVITTQASGSPGTVTWTASFTAPFNGPFAATATVASSTNQDSNTANNTASTTITVSPRFDLSTTITGPATVTQGNLLTYTVTTSNATGGSIAQNGQEQITGLPTGLTQVFVSNGGVYNALTTSTTATFNGVSYTVPAGGVLFPPQAFATGQTVSNTVSFVASGAAGSLITPTATVTPNTSAGGDTNPANNTAFLNATAAASSTTILAPATADQANVYTTVSTNAAGPVAAGTSVMVNVAVGNYGPQAAAIVQETVTLQPGLAVTGLPSGATYDAATGVVTFGPLALLASAGSLGYSFSFVAPATGPVLIAAAARSSTLDPVPADNAVTTKVDIAPSTDVATSLAGPATATAGQPVTYIVTTRNIGVSAASSVAQTVLLPVGLTTLQLNGSAGTLAGGIVTFADGATYDTTTGVLALPVIASAAAGTTRINSLTFLTPLAGGTLSLIANVSSSSADRVPTNNSARVSTAVQSSLDVAVTLSGPPSTPIFSSVAYTVTTTNNGPAVASSVVPTLQLPTNLVGLTKPTNATYDAATGLVTFATLSNLASGASVTETVSFMMPDVAQLTGLAAITVSGTVSDRNLDNNRSSLTTRATTPTDPKADLSANVTAAQSSFVAGARVTLTATFANAASATSDTAPNVRPVLALPANLTNVTVSNGGTYDAASGLVTWPVTTSLLASDITGYVPLVYTVALDAPGAGPLIATASVSSDVSDPAVTNNSKVLTVTIDPANDVATYVTGPASVTAGNMVTYAVTTINNGPSTASMVNQTITLPAGVTSYSLNGSSPQAGSGTVTILTLTSQQPGAAGAITQTVSFTAPNTNPGFSLTGNVTASLDAATTGNNVSTATTNLTNRPPVALNVVNTLQTPEGNTAVMGLSISPLAATDADGNITIIRYNLLTIPSTAQGVLLYDNGGTYTSITSSNYAGLNLTVTQAATLRFDPVSAFVGNVMFQYTATDNGNGGPGNALTSDAALYTLVVGKDNDSFYTATPAKGGTNANSYHTNDVLAFVIDANGARYNGDGTIYYPADNAAAGKAAGTLVATDGSVASGLSVTSLAPTGPSQNPANTLPSGVSLNPATGQIYVSDASKLPAITTAATYYVNVVTTDLLGGTNITTAIFTLGAYPLPVELAAFTAQAVQNTDAELSWTTASEKNNDHFDVERSLDGGRTFERIGRVAGQGSKASPTAYSFTDKGIGRQASGSVYYRLRQVDTDGQASFSPVRTVAFTTPVAPTAASISLYPVPATTSTTLDLSALPAARYYSVRLTDLSGRLVSQQLLAGGQTHVLNLTSLATGAYLVQVSGADSQGMPRHFVKRLTKE